MKLVPVDYDPFEQKPGNEPRLVPVDYDPFEQAPQNGPRLVPVDHDPFAEAAAPAPGAIATGGASDTGQTSLAVGGAPRQDLITDEQIQDLVSRFGTPEPRNVFEQQPAQKGAPLLPFLADARQAAPQVAQAQQVAPPVELGQAVLGMLPLPGNEQPGPAVQPEEVLDQTIRNAMESGRLNPEEIPRFDVQGPQAQGITLGDDAPPVNADDQAIALVRAMLGQQQEPANTPRIGNTEGLPELPAGYADQLREMQRTNEQRQLDLPPEEPGQSPRQAGSDVWNPDRQINRPVTAANSLIRGGSPILSSVPKQAAVQSAQNMRENLPLNEMLPERQRLQALAGSDDEQQATTARALLDQADADAGLDPTQNPQYQAAEDVDRWVNETFRVNPEYAREFWSGKLPNALGSGIAFLGATIVTRSPGGAFLGATANAQEAFEDALQSGASIADATQAANYSGVFGISEVVPFANLLDRLDKTTGGSARKVISNALKQGTEEAVQEASQSIWKDLVAKKIVEYDPQRQMFVGTGEDAGVGFTAGNIFGALGTLLTGRRSVTLNQAGKELAQDVDDTVLPNNDDLARQLTHPDNAGVRLTPVEGNPFEQPAAQQEQIVATSVQQPATQGDFVQRDVTPMQGEYVPPQSEQPATEAPPEPAAQQAQDQKPDTKTRPPNRQNRIKQLQQRLERDRKVLESSRKGSRDMTDAERAQVEGRIQQGEAELERQQQLVNYPDFDQSLAESRERWRGTYLNNENDEAVWDRGYEQGYLAGAEGQNTFPPADNEYRPYQQAYESGMIAGREQFRRGAREETPTIDTQAGQVTEMADDQTQAGAVPATGVREADQAAPDLVQTSEEVGTDTAQIDDFGEKIGGARKDQAASLQRELSDDDIASQPLSKIWPKKEIDEITDPFTAAVAHAARAEIPSKPRNKHKVKNWVGKVKTVRSLAQRVLDGEIGRDELSERLSSARGLEGFAARVRALEAVDRTQWDRIGKVEEYPDAMRYGEDGEKIPSPFVSVEIDGRRRRFDGATSVDQRLDEINRLLQESEPTEKRMQFEVRGRPGRYFINKKGDSEYRPLETFETAEAATAYRRDNHDDLVAAWEAIKERDNVKKTDMRSTENRPRTGADHRQGQDVTPQMFRETFGFRGVEFGNWVKQGKNASERQGMLNQAYDALMDLAEIIGVPPKAISLNGGLGLGFGSRGAGWASAHFEPNKFVINLTKTRGAGALAHEWFHALDNYFQRQRGEGNNRETRYITYNPETYYEHPNGARVPAEQFEAAARGEKGARYRIHDPKQWTKKEGVRPEVEVAFADLVKTLDDSPMTERSARIKGEYWSRIIERAARSFENYIIAKMDQKGYQNDYLANVASIEAFKRNPDRYPYLLEEEVAPVEEAFDRLFETLETKETDKGVALFSKRPGTGEPQRLAEAWEQIADDELAFQYPASEATDIVEIARDMGGKMGWKAASEVKRRYDHDAGRMGAHEEIEIYRGGGQPIMTIYQAETSNPYPYIGDENRGVRGSLAYQIAMTWAHNNGKVMTPDSVITHVNRLRRTEAMVSSMLRHGTSRHLEPHPDQFVGLLPEQDYQATQDAEGKAVSLKDDLPAVYEKLEEIKEAVWVPESRGKNEAERREIYYTNLENMLMASAALVQRRLPEVKQWEFRDGDFQQSNPQQRSVLQYNREENTFEVPRDVATEKGTGDTTIKRAVVTASLLHEEVVPRVVAKSTLIGGERVRPRDPMAVHPGRLAGDLVSRPVETQSPQARSRLKDTLYSQQKPGTAGLSVSRLEQIIAPVILKWGDSAPRVEVVASLDQVPEHIVDSDAHPAGSIEGVHYAPDGEIYLVADTLTEERALKVLAHEAIGHHSFEEMLGEDLDAVLERVQWLKKSGDNKVAEIADEVAQRYGRLDKPTEAKEIVAVLAERGIRHPLLSQVVAAIRKFLRKLGLSLQWTEAELEALVAKAARRLETGKGERKNREPTPTSKMFSKGPQETMEAIDEAASATPTWQEAFEQSAYEDMEEWMGDLTQKTRPGWLGLLTRLQLEDMGKDVLPQITDYIRVAQRMDADRNHLINEAAETIKPWNALRRNNPEMANYLADVMHEATLAGVDPAEAYTPVIEKADAAERIKGLRQQALANSAEAYRYIQQVNEIQQRLGFEARRKQEHPRLVRMYNKLSPEAQKVYKQVRDLYAERFKAVQEALEQRINRSQVSQNEKRRYIQELRARFESMQVQSPYFPLARFGDYWVNVKRPGDWQKQYTVKPAGEGYGVFRNKARMPMALFESRQAAVEHAQELASETEFHMFENPSDQQKFADDQRRKGFRVEVGKKLENNKAIKGASESFAAEVIEKITATGAEADRIKDAIWQLYLSNLPDMSIRKNLIHRKKTPGFSADAQRAFAHNMFHGSYQLARLRHSDIMEEYLNNMQEGLSQTRDPNRATDYFNEMQKRHEWAMNPMGKPWANAATQLGFVWYLGLTPAAAVVNTTQTALVALPVMAARYGWSKTPQALIKASMDFFDGHVSAADGVFSAAESSGLTADEQRAFQRWLDEGVIDKTLGHDLAQQSETPAAIYSDTKNRVMEVVSYLFHHAERFNREVTALATYRLARDKGLSHDKAADEARRVVFESHFDYSAPNKARFMQNDAAKVILLFRQYSQNMTYMVGRSAYQSLKGESPEVRAEARKKIAGILGMVWLFAGAEGFPGASMVEFVLNSIFDDEDEPWDFRTEFHNFLADYFGENVANIILTGPMNQITGADIHSRVSLDELWIREPYRDLEAQKAVEYYLLQLGFGPMGSIVANAGRGADFMREGKVWRGIEAMTPKAIRDAMKAMRYANEGVLNLRGDQVVDDISAWDIFLQGSGFSPADVTKQYDVNSAIRDYQYRLRDRRQLLINRWWLAHSAGDTEGAREALEAMARFSRKNPGMKIDRDTLYRSARMRRRRSAESQGGVHLRKSERYLRDRVRFGDD